MLSKAIVFVFSFLGVFTLMLATFNTVPFPVNEASGGTPTEIRKSFAIADMAVYGSGGTDNMTYSYSSLTDIIVPAPPQWVTSMGGKYLEMWWGTSFEGGVWYGKHLEVRDAQKENWLGREWWDNHALTLTSRSGITVGTRIGASILQLYYEPIFNATYFSGRCDHLSTSVLFQYNETAYASITEAFDDGHLSYSLTYGLDYNATGLSAWSIIGSLLSFQAPDIGLTGVGGTILSGIIAAPLIACVMYLAYKIITGIIPWVSGGSGD